jgi:1-acyl-sn-glycerol-3-phosphate acyltransferase
VPKVKVPGLKFGWMVRPFYWTCVHLLRGILWVLGRWEVTGRENIPVTGPLVVVSNHLNNADPPILAAGIARRRVRFMAKIELFKMPFGVLIKGFGAFPVRRFDADVGALLGAERLLKHGEPIGMFPEGTRSRTGTMGRPHPGTALIALRAGAPVLPCAMTGTERLRNPLVVLRKPRITIAIGEPILVEKVKRPTEEQVSDLTNQIYEAINALLPPEYRGSYTGVEVAKATHGGDSPGN